MLCSNLTILKIAFSVYFITTFLKEQKKSLPKDNSSRQVTNVPSFPNPLPILWCRVQVDRKIGLKGSWTRNRYANMVNNFSDKLAQWLIWLVVVSFTLYTHTHTPSNHAFPKFPCMRPYLFITMSRSLDSDRSNQIWEDERDNTLWKLPITPPCNWPINAYALSQANMRTSIGDVWLATQMPPLGLLSGLW